jgi:hypothetical protein
MHSIGGNLQILCMDKEADYALLWSKGVYVLIGKTACRVFACICISKFSRRTRFLILCLTSQFIAHNINLVRRVWQACHARSVI